MIRVAAVGAIALISVAASIGCARQPLTSLPVDTPTGQASPAPHATATTASRAAPKGGPPRETGIPPPPTSSPTDIPTTDPAPIPSGPPQTDAPAPAQAPAPAPPPAP